MEGDSFKITKQNPDGDSLIDIQEVNSISSNDERSISKDRSFDTFYSGWKDSDMKTSRHTDNFQNEQIRKMAGLKVPGKKVEIKEQGVQVGTESRDMGTWTVLKIPADDLVWDDMNLDNPVGKEAAKTMIALDYYMDSVDIEQPRVNPNPDIVNFDEEIADLDQEKPNIDELKIEGEGKRRKSKDPKLTRSTFSPFIPESILAE